MGFTATALLVLATAIAPLDCASPEMPVGRAICADPSLRAADNSLIAAYNALLDRTPAASREAVNDLRSDGDRYREACLATPETQTECLRDETDRLRAIVSGAPVSGTAIGVSFTAMFAGRRETERSTRLTVLLPQILNPKRPGEKRLNRTLANFYRATAFPKPKSGVVSDGAPFGAVGEVSFASANFVSVKIRVVEPGERGEPVVRIVGVNQLLSASAKTRLSDVMVEGADERLAALCATTLDQGTRNLLSGNPLAALTKTNPIAIAPSIRELDSWMLNASGAEIVIQGAESRAVCTLNIAQLRPFLVPGVKIWP